MFTEVEQQNIVEAVKDASTRWKSAFNRGDAIGCATLYEESAVMNVKPLGVFVGVDDIQGFWQKLLNDGFSDVNYSNSKIDVVDAKSAILSSEWQMNKAFGVITHELWVLQPDGTAKLRQDDFQILG